MKVRIIPTILLRNFGVVKTIQFGQHRPLGVASNFARVYNAREVDELIVVDIDATKEARGPDLETVSDVARECFMPLAYGGGVRSVKDVRDILHAGADKVIVNTEAVRRPEFITEVAHQFGAQCVVVSVDVRRSASGYEVFVNGGTEGTGLHPVDWCQQAQKCGAGEIYLNSIDQDGMMKGYDLELIQQVTAKSAIPVIVAGGAGSLEDFSKAVLIGKASAVSAASVFHYTQTTPAAIKTNLHQSGIDVRLF